MRRRQLDIAMSLMVAAVACLLIVVRAPLAVTAVVGLTLFVTVGYVASETLLGDRVLGLERIAAAAGLALMVPVLGGLVLFAAGVSLHRSAWILLLTAVTVICVLSLAIQRRKATSAPAQRFSWRLSGGQLAVYGIAATILVGAVVIARVGADEQRYPGFTQLWLTNRDGDALTLGVSNYQGQSTKYRVVVLRGRHVSRIWNLSLRDQQTWSRTLPPAGSREVRVNLYRVPDLAHPYRYVTTVVESKKS